MFVSIAGTYVLYSAVESVRIEKADWPAIVVRTVSGAEHRHACTGAKTADTLMEILFTRMARNEQFALSLEPEG